uniref:Uncharacterized protein n=1 Tax=Myotis myotis TaxID=51298 RepID=A0A7J7V3V5_MYOMY|nr:hypothetical protein mMyoMyo1_008460 [Myotis myotis]
MGWTHPGSLPWFLPGWPTSRVPPRSNHALVGSFDLACALPQSGAPRGMAESGFGPILQASLGPHWCTNSCTGPLVQAVTNRWSVDHWWFMRSKRLATPALVQYNVHTSDSQVCVSSSDFYLEFQIFYNQLLSDIITWTFDREHKLVMAVGIALFIFSLPPNLLLSQSSHHSKQPCHPLSC